MIKLLPIFLILVAITGGVIYYRFYAVKSTEEHGQLSQSPKTSSKTSPEDQINSLEDIVNSLVKSDLDSRLKSMETGVTELNTRVSSLEKVAPAPPAPQVATSRVPVYIPLGSGGSLSDQNWTSLNAFQISLDPASYSGYSSMKLEVNMRLNQPGGGVFVRLYNLSNNVAVSSSEASTDSTASSAVTSGGFTLVTGQKTYVLQAKSSAGTQAFVDYARIKVNF